MRVEVSAPARLHLGDLDPFALGRFGYAPILAIHKPRTVVEAQDSGSLKVYGLEAKETETYAQRVLEAFNLKGARITVKAVAPRHSGFGSTTQLCLSIGRAVTEAYGLDVSLLELIKALRRTSTGGMYTFQLGGFVVAGGFRVKAGEKVLMRKEPMIPPLVFRSEFPEDWRFVLVRPLTAPKSPDGEMEEKYFKALRKGKAPIELTQKAYFILASKLLPAVLEKDAEAFGNALTEIQVTVGRIYQPVQGSVFNPASQWLIPVVRRSGALGIGQSSWGPTIYAFTRSPEEARKVAGKVRKKVNGKAVVGVVGVDNKGARVKALLNTKI